MSWSGDALHGKTVSDTDLKDAYGKESKRFFIPQKVYQEVMLLTYLKDTDSRQILRVKMTNITQIGEVPLPGLQIRFYNNERRIEKQELIIS